MKITLCGSIHFLDEMLKIKAQLEKLDHEVKMPPLEIEDDQGGMIPVQEYYKMRKAEPVSDSWIWDRKEQAMRWHFDKVAGADAILVLNYSKNNVSNYVGANTLLEMGLAFFLNKRIYLLNPIPDMHYSEEIIGMRPIIIDNDLSLIS